VLEIRLDHCIDGGAPQRAAIFVLERDERLDAAYEFLVISHKSGCASQIGNMAMSTPRPLLDRQASLLAYLTSGPAIFRDGNGAGDPGPPGIDRAALDLLARFSHDKRVEKIAAIFPITFEVLGSRANAVIREFAEMCPPTVADRMGNAHRFYGFLLDGPRDKQLDRPHLQDVAAFELAYANARISDGDSGLPAEEVGRRRRGWIRRGRGVALLRCSHDLRSVFEGRLDGTVPEKRDTPLAIRSGAAHPDVFEMAPVEFEVLAAIGDWTDPATLGDVPNLAEVIGDLTRCHLIEPAP
jgi:hypothetical protein